MPVLFKQYLSGEKIYTCSSCGTHAADHEELVSKAFQGRHGRAYLFSNVVNVMQGPCEDRLLITGLHTVCDIQCTTCGSVLGWKYETAYEESQKYKEGKYILEKAKVLKEGAW
jgi:DNA-directed RNA polymerase subunit RPC12/RpoP|eukprot:jgi/Picsp_1/4185/NSC_01694-R1_protein